MQFFDNGNKKVLGDDILSFLKEEEKDDIYCSFCHEKLETVRTRQVELIMVEYKQRNQTRDKALASKKRIAFIIVGILVALILGTLVFIPN